ncbi:lactonase family protein [Allomuricauda sp. SCSIO 65647]|uniref:lactonase family protein n=1 Tax=Allomuricauda sp. SCSIO 65647 TaxID=2908843 RepID=UPI001F2BE311|nr:lactonase family protein [Muricauda sp. SCSIO 65647]UJH68500.1 lactonase family protein [Muricauda sp. SCSIO 65647]
MMLTFFMGSYTEYLLPDFGGTGLGIYTVQMNTETGGLKALYSIEARNPSYLALSDDGRMLYCNTELAEDENPVVKAFMINKDFSLQFVNEQVIPGGYPCHIKTYTNNALVACYATGNVLQFPLDPAGKVMPLKNEHHHSGSSINKVRQEAPHPHQIAIHPNQKDIFVCDLGIDTIKTYRFEGDMLMADASKDTKVSSGGGPRHMVFDPNGTLAYVLNELSGEVSVLEKGEGHFKQIGSYSSLPEDYSEVPSGSAIRILPNGKFLYAANRKVEAITIFKIIDRELQLVDIQYTGGAELREFNITPNGEWLIACHQNSHDTVVYKVQENGKLEERYRTKEFLSPVCIVFPDNDVTK